MSDSNYLLAVLCIFFDVDYNFRLLCLSGQYDSNQRNRGGFFRGRGSGRDFRSYGRRGGNSGGGGGHTTNNYQKQDNNSGYQKQGNNSSNRGRGGGRGGNTSNSGSSSGNKSGGSGKSK